MAQFEKFITFNLIKYFIMKLSANEKQTLRLLVRDPNLTNNDISESLEITAQGVGKIRKQLSIKGLIESQELNLDYEKLDINIQVIALMKILPSAFKKFKKKELDSLTKPTNAIKSYAIPKTDITHIIIYAFKNIKEYDKYFRDILDKFGDTVEIKDSFVLSSESIIKSSSKDMFLNVLDNMIT
jgi:DNA-binding Lrp family transcriptional regulator